jgi:hypothetical protein
VNELEITANETICDFLLLQCEAQLGIQQKLCSGRKLEVLQTQIISSELGARLTVLSPPCKEGYKILTTYQPSIFLFPLQATCRIWNLRTKASMAEWMFEGIIRGSFLGYILPTTPSLGHSTEDLPQFHWTQNPHTHRVLACRPSSQNRSSNCTPAATSMPQGDASF